MSKASTLKHIEGDRLGMCHWLVAEDEFSLPVNEM
jgi:hypothetical protein